MRALSRLVSPTLFTIVVVWTRVWAGDDGVDQRPVTIAPPAKAAPQPRREGPPAPRPPVCGTAERRPPLRPGATG